MRKKLSQRGVEAEKPDPRRVRVISDTLSPGLQLRVSPSGAKSWAWWGRVREVDGPGKPRRITIGPLSEELALGAARARAREIRALARAGVDPVAEDRRRLEAQRTQEREEQEGTLTLGALVTDFLAWGTSRYRPNTLAGWKRLARVELAPLAERPADALRRHDVRELLAAIEERSGWLSNRTLELVRRCYSWAIEQDRLETSPCVGIRKLFTEEKSERVLSHDETRAILRALEPDPIPDPTDRSGERKLEAVDADHAAAIRLLWLTGVRRGAVLGMQRSELTAIEDPKSARWTIPGGLHGRAKNRKPHTVPLVAQAVAIIRPRLEGGGEHVFPPKGPGRDPERQASTMGWESREIKLLKARADALLERSAPRWRIHDIRHTVATLLREELKVSRDVVSLILGHVEGPAATRVYDRAELLEERRSALVAWAGWLDRLVAEEKTGAEVVPIASRRS
jgi:integrase